MPADIVSWNCERCGAEVDPSRSYLTSGKCSVCGRLVCHKCAGAMFMRKIVCRDCATGAYPSVNAARD